MKKIWGIEIGGIEDIIFGGIEALPFSQIIINAIHFSKELGYCVVYYGFLATLVQKTIIKMLIRKIKHFVIHVHGFRLFKGGVRWRFGIFPKKTCIKQGRVCLLRLTDTYMFYILKPPAPTQNDIL